jgi:tRNA(Arg) A34 adenosine deaminase TadA
MCAGKIYWAGIRAIVFALSSEELAVLAGGSVLIPCRELFDRAVEPMEVTGPLSLSSAREVHVGFWPPAA